MVASATEPPNYDNVSYASIKAIASPYLEVIWNIVLAASWCPSKKSGIRG